MSKPIIAVDIDDVLSANAEGFIAFSNQRWGTNLTAEDYTEDWAVLFKVDQDEARRRSDDFHASGAIRDYKHHGDAVEVLNRLKQHYSLVIVTSRRSLVIGETKQWLDEFFIGVFDDVVFAGIYDQGQHHHKTKAETLQEIGADYLIDDQPKHCLAAAGVGIKTIMYGDYPWNRDVDLPEGVTRCLDWQAVREYFDAA